MLPRQFRDTEWSFAGQGLAIERSFTGDYKISIRNFRLEFGQVGDEFKSWTNCGAAKRHQTESEATCGTSAGLVPKVEMKLLRNDISQSRQSVFQFRNVVRRASFLRTEYLGRTVHA